MECMQCGHENEKDARFCRKCGSQMGVPKGVTPSKDQTEFVPTKRRTQEDFLCFGEEHEATGGYVLGAVFIVIGLLVAAAVFLPAIFSDFGSGIGGFFGGFGENMGQIGSDFGEFMGNWGEYLGESVGSFFSGQVWWDLIKIFIVLAFFIVGAIIIILNYRKR